MTFYADHRHPDWCSHTHRCGFGEHRAEPVTVTIRDAGSFTLTRVQAANGRQHAEIRLSIPLPANAAAARARLAYLLTTLRSFLRHAASLPR